MLTHWSYVFLALTDPWFIQLWVYLICGEIHLWLWVLLSPTQYLNMQESDWACGYWRLQSHRQSVNISRITGERYVCLATEATLITTSLWGLNTLRPRQNGRHFPDDIFQCIFLNENVWILIKIPLKFVPKGPMSNIPALVQIMAWRRPGDMPLSEPMMVRLQTLIFITRPQWVHTLRFEQDGGQQFSDDNLKSIFLKETFLALLYWW